MARAFKFRLEALKKFREHRLLSAKKDMAVVLEKIQQIETKIVRCENEARGAMKESFDFSSGKAALLALGAQLLGGEIQRKSQLHQEKVLAEKELEKHREWIAHLAKELRAVEKLEERQRERHKQTLFRKEKRAMDSWVAETWPQSKLRGEAS